VIPEEWLHATVQGIHHAIDAGQLDKLRDTLREEVTGLEPFQVQLGPVWPGITAVTVAVYSEGGMAELNGRVRTAMEKVPGITLRAPAREERRRLRRRREARPRAAELGRSRGGLTSKVHLSADRRCRPLSFVLTPGQAADSPRFFSGTITTRERDIVSEPTAVLLIGIAGSGKTHLSQALAARGLVCLSVDEAVHRLHGRYGVDYPEHGACGDCGCALHGPAGRPGTW
jgi:hypothetical protein